MTTSQNRGIFKPAAIALSALLLTGCATFSGDGGINDVSVLTKERIGQGVSQAKTEQDSADAASAVDQLLAKPLTADSAVQLA